MNQRYIQELKAILNVFNLMLSDDNVNVQDWVMATYPKLKEIIEYLDTKVDTNSIPQETHEKPKTNKEILQMLHRDYPEFWKFFSGEGGACPDKFELKITGCADTCPKCWEKAIGVKERELSLNSIIKNVEDGDPQGRDLLE